MDLLARIIDSFAGLFFTTLSGDHAWETILRFMPFVICFELPYQGLIMLGIFKHFLRNSFNVHSERLNYPRVSCIVLCYSEGAAVRQTLRSLCHQLYPGTIELLVMVDGASANQETYQEALKSAAELNGLPRRQVRVIPKWQRGGRVSSMNSGLALAGGTVVMALDGDTSFDNDMVYRCVRHFDDPHVVGVSGTLRVRNAGQSLCTGLQALEYMTSISGGRTGLSEWGTLNNISGAFGVFRRSFLKKVGGWRQGTAEDLDMTTRIKQYFGRYPELKIVFEPLAVGHTDVPATFIGLLQQRTRWDGDLGFIYLRRYWKSFTPALLGWRNLIFYVGAGLLFQLVAPFAIVIYTCYLFLTQDLAVVCAVLLYIYCFYLVAIFIFFIQYLLMVSERPRYDLSFLPIFPLFPIYSFILRVWCALALLKEICTSSHQDTSMAPWWVLKKSDQ